MALVPPPPESSKVDSFEYKDHIFRLGLATNNAGTVTNVTASSPLTSTGGATPNITFSGILSVARGGTGTSTPNLVAGTGISLSGTWPNQTITNTAPATGTVTSVSVTTANGVSGTVATATTTPAISLSLGAITPSSVAATGTVTGSNLSGTNTGNQTITLTGDVTGSGTGSFATTLAIVNSNIGTFNSVTVNAKGLVTAASNTAGAFPITTTTIDLTLTQSNYTVLVDATAGAVVITLPTVASSFVSPLGKVYVIKKIDSSVNSVTVQANGAELIDGSNTKILSSQYSAISPQASSTVWNIIGKV